MEEEVEEVVNRLDSSNQSLQWLVDFFPSEAHSGIPGKKKIPITWTYDTAGWCRLSLTAGIKGRTDYMLLYISNLGHERARFGCRALGHGSIGQVIVLGGKCSESIGNGWIR